MSLSKRARLNLIGVIILLVGFGSGAFLFSRGDNNRSDAGNDAEGPLDVQDSRKATRQVEMDVGKVGMVIYRVQNALGEWAKPRPLGITIMVVSVIASCIAFWRADVPPKR